MADTAALAAARDSGLVAEGAPLLVMLSGGADSVCLLDVALELGAQVSALHVNYGLRPSAEQDEAHCRGLCATVGVELAVERAWLPSEGNLHQLARDARYRLAERLARGDYAAAHTATDQAETILYRLAVSPGRRALLGMAPRRGRLVRPLLHATAEDTREHCVARGLQWREDPSNDDPAFSRARVRARLVPALEEVSGAAVRTVTETARLLRDEAEVLDAVVDEALEGLGGGAVAVTMDDLRALPVAVRRLVLRRLAERATGGTVAITADQVDAVLGLGRGGGTASLDLGGGLQVVAEYGTLRMRHGGPLAPPDPVPLAVPGEASFGPWDVRADPGAGGEVVVSAEAVEPGLGVRGWRDGDRMRPLGLHGTKTLQDLFTDRKVPRDLRRSLPVVVCGDDVVWVAGLAVDERFVAPDGGADVVGLSARRRQ